MNIKDKLDYLVEHGVITAWYRDDILADETFKDAERYRWLMKHKVSMSKANSEGPACPELYLQADIWNKQPELSAVSRITAAIDERLYTRY